VRPQFVHHVEAGKVLFVAVDMGQLKVAHCIDPCFRTVNIEK